MIPSKIVLVSGGSDGLGREIARLLVAECRVVLLSHDPARCESAARELGCDFRVCDVSDAGAVDAAIASVLAAYGRIDCLVNNA